LEIFLAIRRSGARRLEQWFGPGKPDTGAVRGRRPLVVSENIEAVGAQSRALLATLAPEIERAVRAHGYTACVATSDVHEYGKIMVEQILDGLDVALVDGGVSVDPADLVDRARRGEADFIALSTYNGIALSYLTTLRQEMAQVDLDIPVFIGGRLNQVPDGSNTSLPVDVTDKLSEVGAVTCDGVGEMLECPVAEGAAPDDGAAKTSEDAL
jgi:methylmalonyl-CoA mutase cobalamin-binding subunit